MLFCVTLSKRAGNAFSSTVVLHYDKLAGKCGTVEWEELYEKNIIKK